ncbi:MAG: SGNH/GDSL hydrolase family protein [Hyphomicrobiaceae bacterium]|nr:SGNH/GDSL hydrolase family protein [Hyphomicrobiaceae bacterium]
MPTSFKELLANLALAVGAAVFTLAVIETIVFGLVLKPDDVLENVTLNGVVRYQPGQQAIFRHPDGRATLVSINADGWNSTKPAYVEARQPGVQRIAVVGDSYVHGAFVDLADSFPEIIERQLNAAGQPTEVYRFGMDGAPLSQYLHMLRREVVRFRPDVVVVPLIHNDFDESYRLLKTRYASSFLKLETSTDGGVREVAPAPFSPSLADRLRAFATFRYVYYETGLYLNAKDIVSRVFWGGQEEWDARFIQSAVDIRKIADHDANRVFARHVLAEMKALADTHGFKLLFVMDGVREAVYADKPQSAFEVGRLNALAAELTSELGLEFLDLYEAFKADWLVHGRRFEFAYDWHWNRRGNLIIASVISEKLLADGEPGGPERSALGRRSVFGSLVPLLSERAR